MDLFTYCNNLVASQGSKVQRLGTYRPYQSHEIQDTWVAMALFFHNRHHYQWQRFFAHREFKLSLRILLNTVFQMVTTNCLKLANRGKIIGTPWAKWLLRPCTALKNLWILCIQFCCLEKHKCLLLSLHKSSSNVWKTSMWPLHFLSFGINSSRSLISSSYSVVSTTSGLWRSPLFAYLSIFPWRTAQNFSHSPW